MKRLGLLAAGVLLAGVAGLASATPINSRAYTIVNDGVFVVTSLQVRVGADWSENLLETPVKPGERRDLRLADDGRPCLVDLAINTDTRSMNTFLLDQNICESPLFHVSSYFDPSDLPGRGRGRARTGAVRGAPAPAPEIERGLPLCPGDARCRKKPG